MGDVAMGVQVELAVHVDAQEREQRFVHAAIGALLGVVTKIEPDAVVEAVVVIVDVPVAGQAGQAARFEHPCFHVRRVRIRRGSVVDAIRARDGVKRLARKIQIPRVVDGVAVEFKPGLPGFPDTVAIEVRERLAEFESAVLIQILRPEGYPGLIFWIGPQHDLAAELAKQGRVVWGCSQRRDGKKVLRPIGEQRADR